MEIGKKGIWSAARVAQERPDVDFYVVAVDFLPATVMGRSLGHMSALLARGAASALVRVGHAMNDVAPALRQLMRAQHIGEQPARHTTKPLWRTCTVARTGARRLRAPPSKCPHLNLKY